MRISGLGKRKKANKNVLAFRHSPGVKRMAPKVWAEVGPAYVQWLRGDGNFPCNCTTIIVYYVY